MALPNLSPKLESNTEHLVRTGPTVLPDWQPLPRTVCSGEESVDLGEQLAAPASFS